MKLPIYLIILLFSACVQKPIMIEDDTLEHLSESVLKNKEGLTIEITTKKMKKD